jgi:hypothetical protein
MLPANSPASLVALLPVLGNSAMVGMSLLPVGPLAAGGGGGRQAGGRRGCLRVGRWGGRVLETGVRLARVGHARRGRHRLRRGRRRWPGEHALVAVEVVDGCVDEGQHGVVGDRGRAPTRTHRTPSHPIQKPMIRVFFVRAGLLCLLAAEDGQTACRRGRSIDVARRAHIGRAARGGRSGDPSSAVSASTTPPLDQTSTVPSQPLAGHVAYLARGADV